jgi:hypothetical protein
MSSDRRPQRDRGDGRIDGKPPLARLAATTSHQGGDPMQTATEGRSGSMPESPIDDATYNVMMALASKLEAIDVYKKYANDGMNTDLWAELARDDRRHADRLLEELRNRISNSR